MLTISLTSIPPRFGGLDRVLGALVETVAGRAPILLCLPESYHRFPDWDGALPIIPRGVEIVRAARDDGPATKLTGALGRAEGDVLICDDDVIYDRDWFDAFEVERKYLPGQALSGIAGAVRRLLATDAPDTPLNRIGHGHAGFLVPDAAKVFGGLKIDGPCRWVDDIWISGHLARSGIGIYEVPEASLARSHILDAPEPLQNAELDGMRRAALNRACLAQFEDVWPPA